MKACASSEAGTPPQPGTLVYVMGPSGSGKDSLMRYARERLNGHGRIAFGHRYITRPAERDGENHVALSEPEFHARDQAGFFALSWRAHGCCYGIGIELDAWLDAGWTVVVNGSRAHFEEARRRYSRAKGLLVQVARARLRARLSQRAREPLDEIEQRLARHDALAALPLDGVHRLRNDGSLRACGERFVRQILTAAAAPADYSSRASR